MIFDIGRMSATKWLISSPDKTHVMVVECVDQDDGPWSLILTDEGESFRHMLTQFPTSEEAIGSAVLRLTRMSP